MPEIVGGTSKPIRLVGAPVRVAVPVDTQTVETLDAVVPAAARQHRAVLEIDNVEAEHAPGTVYGVYVNLPDDPSDSDLEEHHVGNVSLFGVERARAPQGPHHPHSVRFAMEITDVLDRTAKTGQWKMGNQIHVTLRPLSFAQPVGEAESLAAPPVIPSHENNPITIGRISIHYK